MCVHLVKNLRVCVVCVCVCVCACVHVCVCVCVSVCVLVCGGESVSTPRATVPPRPHPPIPPQAIGLLDDLDKELNTYAMRVREWYGWHFPEMTKIVGDNIAYAKAVRGDLMGPLCAGRGGCFGFGGRGGSGPLASRGRVRRAFAEGVG